MDIHHNRKVLALVSPDPHVKAQAILPLLMKRSEFDFIDKLPGRMPEFHAFNFLIGIVKALGGTPAKITYRLLCIGDAQKCFNPVFERLARNYARPSLDLHCLSFLTIKMLDRYDLS